MRSRCKWIKHGTALILSCVLPGLELSAGEIPEWTGRHEPLEIDGDPASLMVEGIDSFLLARIDEEEVARTDRWQSAFQSADQTRMDFVEARRLVLRKILGVVDPRRDFTHPDIIPRNGSTEPVWYSDADIRVYRIRWPVIGDVMAEGLMAMPAAELPVTDTGRLAAENPSAAWSIAIPDAGQSPESLLGLTEEAGNQSEVPAVVKRLIAAGNRLLLPVTISRTMQKRHSPYSDHGPELTHREYLYRPAFEMGRHLIGYELQTVFSLIDWIDQSSPAEGLPAISVIGHGDGGMLALYAAALDTRIGTAAISGCFGNGDQIWNQPIDRNVFGLLKDFGDAQLAAMVAPRRLLIGNTPGPRAEFPGRGGAPAILTGPSPIETRQAFLDARTILGSGGRSVTLHEDAEDQSESSLTEAVQDAAAGRPGKVFLSLSDRPLLPVPAELDAEIRKREERMIHQWDRHTQQLLLRSPYERQEFMKNLDTSSAEAFAESVDQYRSIFRDEIIGVFDMPLSPPRPRLRHWMDGDGFSAVEVVLDVFPEVIAYGILCIPNGLENGSPRPVVVCQHGLEGRPSDIIRGDHHAYHDFAAKIAQRGFITFSPQNPYIFQDRFRSLQRKANPLGKTLFSIITPQHRQIVNWLKTLPVVDPDRIAFYGLSYGGKTAMRVPALVTDYCLSICSADFNDWVWKNASTLSPYSYVWTGEYEIFEFNLGRTFNYSEMAALIAPRPFMVERGHFDGVAPDERVALEFAKVRHLYQARLGLKNRCEIEWFAGPHTIHGIGTFEFLHRHLDFPAVSGDATD